MPLPFSDRNRYRAAAARFRTVDDQTPGVLTRDQYWINNRPTLKSTTWASVTDHLPIIPPATETTEIKNTIFNSYINRLQDAEGEWTGKTSLFLSSFEHLVPAASLEADVVIADFNNFGSDVFEFDAYACYNSMYEHIVVGNGANFTNPERTEIKWFQFALNVAPRQTNVGNITMQPDKFPSRRTSTVFLRALLKNAGSLHNSITKVVLRTRASTLPTLYGEQQQPFEPAIKHSDSSYADPAKFGRIMKQVKAETKFEAIKQIIAPVYVGRTDGIKRV
jgi:hypothetical protein